MPAYHRPQHPAKCPLQLVKRRESLSRKGQLQRSLQPFPGCRPSPEVDTQLFHQRFAVMRKIEHKERERERDCRERKRERVSEEASMYKKQLLTVLTWVRYDQNRPWFICKRVFCLEGFLKPPPPLPFDPSLPPPPFVMPPPGMGSVIFINLLNLFLH